MKTHVKNHQAGFTLIEFIVALVVAGIVASMVYTYFGSALTQSSVPIDRLRQVSNLHKVMENIIADYNRLNTINLRYKWQANTSYGLNSVVTPNDESKKNGHYYKCTTTGISGASEPSWTTSGTQPTDGGVTWTESGDTAVLIWQKNHAYTSGTSIVLPVNNNGHYYKCTAGVTSGASEPSWTTSGTQPTDGGVTWTEVGTILNSNEGTIGNLFTLLPDVGGTDTKYGTGYTVTEKVFIRFEPDNPSPPPKQETTTGVTENNILKVTIKNDNSTETLTQYFTIR